MGLEYKKAECQECKAQTEVAYCYFAELDLCTDCMADWDICRACGSNLDDFDMWDEGWTCPSCVNG